MLLSRCLADSETGLEVELIRSFTNQEGEQMFSPGSLAMPRTRQMLSLVLPTYMDKPNSTVSARPWKNSKPLARMAWVSY